MGVFPRVDGRRPAVHPGCRFQDLKLGDREVDKLHVDPGRYTGSPTGDEDSKLWLVPPSTINLGTEKSQNSASTQDAKLGDREVDKLRVNPQGRKTGRPQRRKTNNCPQRR